MIERPQGASEQLNALMQNIGSSLSDSKNQKEADLAIDKGFKSLLVFVPDVHRAGKIMDELINAHREEMNGKGIEI